MAKSTNPATNPQMPAMNPALPETISTREAAKLLGTSLRTVQLWVENATLEAWKTPGGHRRVTMRSINRILEERAQSLGLGAARHYKVLIVEDDQQLLALYAMTFKQWGLPIELTIAENGYDGLIKIGELQPDLLISDLQMPHMNGFEMIRTLRRSATIDMRIIVITGLDQTQIAAQGGLPEDIPVLTKPIRFAELRQIVKTALESRLSKN